MYDVTVIGAGVTGCAIARELSRYEVKVCVIDRCSDICEGTSKANSGIVHAGHDAATGSWKAKMNLEGNRMMKQLCEDLDVSFRQNGSLVLCFREEDKGALEKLYEKGCANGVKGLQQLSASEVRVMEPALSNKTVAALYAPTGGIVCPFELTMALAENAFVNGTEFMLETEVLSVKKAEQGYELETDKGKILTKTVVNAAGVYADVFHNMISEERIHITPRRGEYCLLDKKDGGIVDKTIFQLPGAMGKGILVTPTVHGNLLTGPTASDLSDKEAVDTSAEGLSQVLDMAKISVPGLPVRDVITSFAGLRAHEDSDDFVLGEAKGAPGFYDAAGIESPGLTSAPAIGKYIADLVVEKLGIVEKTTFIHRRKGVIHMKMCTTQEQKRLIEVNPAYGNIICRCEMVSEGEILDAIHRPLGATTLDGIKRRTRAGMGRCQAGFCTPKTMEILMRELSLEPEHIRKKGPGSELIAKRR
ncbi:NAD(P)/FAD-dependent oxidoreductase [Lachnotalea sp. AF33-28]|uniref:NAD(P)/FAD-dependent oxidoreductase n=1 Tax=Lachnotalea sp. AF33-28 TaxID=2292046 RepID=UPI000E474CC2|nr:NAD(P)/FAD-dependent oxidoreductase [Lachnotalea sp. AF33-28]RHP33887.1 FAD/NAD(P)-binding oxidoreductase [Lachnotalea sp. AF33-28]